MIPFDLEISSGFQVATYPAGATFGPRALRDYELVWIIEGDVEYRTDQESFSAPQGSIVLCKPNTTDFFRWDPRRRTRHGWFHFQVVGDIPNEWGPSPTWRTVRNPQNEAALLPTLFRELITLGPSQGSIPIPPATQLLAVSLFSSFIRENIQPRSAMETPPYPDAVSRAMAFIAEHLDEHTDMPLSLSEISCAAFVTPEHLCRLFKTYTRHTPAETVRLMRLDRSAVLLARTNYSVGEIASLCGFPSQFHFARRFKDAFGQTPSQMRRQLLEQYDTVPITPLVQIRGK